MASRRPKPRSVVLNLLRVAPERAVPVRQLVEVCGLFGVASNATRVSLTRLVAEGLLEHDARGAYRLGAAARAMGEHVETWRRGEARMRPWCTDWLVTVLPPGAERTQRRHARRAVERLGFREGLPGMWVRPDNLAAPLADTRTRLVTLGLDPAAETFVARDTSERLAARWRQTLWPTNELVRAQARALRALEASLPKLEAMPHREALVESFELGGEAIRLLATDPLLPSEIMPHDTRAALTDAMLRYDAVGHRLWREAVPAPAFATEGAAHAC